MSEARLKPGSSFLWAKAKSSQTVHSPASPNSRCGRCSLQRILAPQPPRVALCTAASTEHGGATPQGETSTACPARTKPSACLGAQACATAKTMPGSHRQALHRHSCWGRAVAPPRSAAAAAMVVPWPQHQHQSLSLHVDGRYWEHLPCDLEVPSPPD